MNFLEKIGHWLFIYSAKKRLLRLNKLENKYMHTEHGASLITPLHRAYSRMLLNIVELDSQYMKFTTLESYLNYKLNYLESKLNG